MSLYETLRHLADSYGLVMIFALYLVLCGWSFLPNSKARVEQAKHSIFEEDENV